MIKKFTAFILLLMLAVSAFADQAAYISKEQAEKAAAMLQGKTQIKHYCAPCGDKSVRTETVNKVEAARTADSKYWEVRVNGVGIDLAYVYFDKKGKWKNLAIAAKINVHEVPKVLPDTLPEAAGK